MLAIEEQWKVDSNYFYSILFLATNDGAQELVEQYEVNPRRHRRRESAWLVLVEKLNVISNAGRVASYKILHNSKLQPGHDLDIWLYAMNGP